MISRILRPGACLLAGLAVLSQISTARAEFSEEKLALVDRPLLGEQIALSPDGRYLAYTAYEGLRHMLYVADLPARRIRTLPLEDPLEPDVPFRRLTTLRFATTDSLVLQSSEGDVVSMDPANAATVQLWRRRDDGIVNDYQNMATRAVAGPARVLPFPSNDPDSIYIESSALIGPDRLANLYRANVRTGDLQIASRGALYVPDQIALYGPGNLILPPPEPGPADDPLPPAPPNPEASSTGVMIYDRTGWPRILYETSLRRDKYRFSYTERGKPSVHPYIMPTALDEHLGQRSFRQEVIGTRGEFDVRPETWFGERSYPLAFDFDPDVVYIASSIGRDTYGIYSLNLRTRERVDLAPDVTGVDLANGDPSATSGILVFDEHERRLVGIRYSSLRPRTRWLDPELAEFQAIVDAELPRHAVEILSWDEERTRFVLRVSSEEDPGAIYIYNRGEERALEQFRSRAPWLASTELNASTSFAFRTTDGVQLSGYVTLPKDSIVDPPPLLIYCAPGLWDRAAPGFNREAEMLADMGLVVMRLNYRGSAGLGRNHLTAIQEGIDTIPIQDLIAAANWLAASRPVDLTRVIVMGEGFGGYLALKAVQTRPDVFRAAIGINAPTNLTAWAQERPADWDQTVDFSVINAIGATQLASGGDALAAEEEEAAEPANEVDAMLIQPSFDFSRTYDFRSLIRTEFVRQSRRGDAELAAAIDRGDFSKPALLISNNFSTDTTSLASLIGSLGFGLQGLNVQRMVISGSFVNGSFETRRAVFRRIEEFLNESLYDFGADIGELREVDEPMPE
jgi:pimeloyl-ACP methyl ester carboxylesterase